MPTTDVSGRIAGDQVIDGKVTDPNGVATHYYALSMPKAPDRTEEAKRTLKLGNHAFLRDVP